MGWVYEASDAELRRLPWPRLRDQAVSVETVFEHWKGRYLELIDLVRVQGLTPHLDERISQAAQALRRIQGQQQRLRSLLDAAPQPRRVERN